MLIDVCKETKIIKENAQATTTYQLEEMNPYWNKLHGDVRVNEQITCTDLQLFFK